MRTNSIQALFGRKFTTVRLGEPWSTVMGEPEDNGFWLIYGAEKHGKTLFALKLADQLSLSKRVLYVSGEEGVGKTFVEAVQRAKLESKNKRVRIAKYTPLDELRAMIIKRNGPRVIFIDNITVYAKELQYGILLNLMREFPKVLFVFIAHEENGQPFTSIARSCRRFSSIIVRVEGLAAKVSGRCPGGLLMVDDVKGRIYWGEPNNENSNSAA